MTAPARHQTCIAIAAGLGAALGQWGLVHMALETAPPEHTQRTLALAALAALAPLAVASRGGFGAPRAFSRGADSRPRHAWSRILSWRRVALGLGIFVVLCFPAERRVHGLAIAALGWAAALHRSDLGATFALVGGPLGLALAGRGSVSSMLLLPLAMVLAVVGGTLVHGRTTLRAGRGLRARPERGLRVGPRVRYGVVLSALMVALSLPLLVGIDTLRRAFGDDASALDAARPIRPDQRPADDSAARDRHERRRGAELVPDTLEFARGEGARIDSDAEVLRVRVTPPAAPYEVLYLRHMGFDRFESNGLTLHDRRPPRLRFDEDDGTRDGWVELSAPTAGRVRRMLAIRTRALRLAGRDWTVLPVPRHVLRVGIEPVRYGEDGPSILEGPQPAWFEYECEEESPSLSRAALGAQAAGPRRDVDLELPPESAARNALALLARRITRDADNDLERVLAVVGYLRGFEYSLEDTEFTGVAGLAEFLERGRGYCTHYASAAMLLLRLVGVPARVAVGHLARSEEDGFLVAREHDAHAWLEVPFEGQGWLTFDPTPSDNGLGGAGQGWSPLADGDPDDRSPRTLLGRWLRQAGEACARWRDGDGDVLTALGRLSRTLPWGAVVATAGALGFGAFALYRQRQRRRVAEAPRAAARDARKAAAGPLGLPDLAAQVADALAERGIRRPPAVPLAVHAAWLASREPDLELLPDLVRLAYRERYGPGLNPTQTLQGQALMQIIARRVGDGNLA